MLHAIYIRPITLGWCQKKSSHWQGTHEVEGGHSCTVRKAMCQQWLHERTTLHLLLAGKTRAGNKRAWGRICCQKSPPTDDNYSNQKEPKGSSQSTYDQSNALHSILCIYAPTMSASPETKDKFYEDLNTTVKNIQLNEFLLLLRDFNARVGSDRDIWPTCLGHPWNWKDEWEWTMTTRILLHTQHLCATNTFFPDKAPSKSIMDTPKIWSLAPTRSYNH